MNNLCFLEEESAWMKNAKNYIICLAKKKDKEALLKFINSEMGFAEVRGFKQGFKVRDKLFGEIEKGWFRQWLNERRALKHYRLGIITLNEVRAYFGLQEVKP